MTPAQFVANFGMVCVDRIKQYYYVRIYINGLDNSEVNMLRKAYPNTKAFKYITKRDPEGQWRWTTSNLSGFDQVIRDLRREHLMDYDFIECMWTYAWCENRHRAKLACKINEMIGGEPLELSRIMRR